MARTDDATLKRESPVASLEGASLAVFGSYEDEELVRLLERAGASVRRFDYGASSSQPSAERWIAELIRSRFDDVIFFSAHAVRLVCEFSRQIGRHADVVDALRRVRIVAQGSRTAAALSEFGLKASARSTTDDVDGLLELLRRIGVHGRTVALPPWDSGASEEIAKWLERAGAEVFSDPPVEPKNPAGALTDALEHGGIDAVVFPSGACVERFWEALGATGDREERVTHLDGVGIIASEAAALVLEERLADRIKLPAKKLRERGHLTSGARSLFTYGTLAELDLVLAPLRSAAVDAAPEGNVGVVDQPVRFAPPASAVQSALGEQSTASTEPNRIESPGSIRVRSRGASI